MSKEPITETSWNRALKSIKRHRGWHKSVPTDDRLASFGFYFDIRLPPTYQQFTRRVGAGELSGWCEFFSCAQGMSETWDMFHRNLNHQGFVRQSSKPDKRSRHLVVFGKFWSGDEYGWDRREVTKRDGKRAAEYAIYSVSRSMDTTVKLAESFPEFIVEYCMGDGLLRLFDDRNDPFDEVRNDFSPRY